MESTLAAPQKQHMLSDSYWLQRYVSLRILFEVKLGKKNQKKKYRLLENVYLH